MPVPDFVSAQLAQGADPLEVMTGGATLRPDPVSRFRWFRAWLSPEVLQLTSLRFRDWAAAMNASGIHPLSLLLSSQTREELAYYQQTELDRLLPGRLEWTDAPWDLVSLGHWGASIRYDGCGNELHLPEGLVIDSALTLLDWKLPGGWPQRFHSVDPLYLERCEGNLLFPPGFRMGAGFRAKHCSGLGNLPHHHGHLVHYPAVDILFLTKYDWCRRTPSLP